MYFMSQNWLITHCLQPWSGLELTGVSEHAEHHAGVLQVQEVLERTLAVWGGGAGERMRTVKCVHFLRG